MELAGVDHVTGRSPEPMGPTGPIPLAGEGGVMADLAESCGERSLKLGVYTSPREEQSGGGDDVETSTGAGCTETPLQRRAEGV